MCAIVYFIPGLMNIMAFSFERDEKNEFYIQYEIIEFARTCTGKQVKANAD